MDGPPRRNGPTFPLLTTAPDAPPQELGPVCDIVGEAVVVGVARGAHGAAELTRLTDRLVRLLVTERGFRTLAIEASAAFVSTVDTWLRTGHGDLGSLLVDAEPWWRASEFVDVLRWLRSFNRHHPDDPVRLLGLETAAAHDMDTLEQIMAKTAIDHVEKTGHKVVYWSGSHSAVGHRRAVAWRPEDEEEPGSRNAGSRLREHFGSGYRSLGLSFHHGSVLLGDRVVKVPPAPADFVDARLDRPGSDLWLVDLRPDERGCAISELAGAPLQMRLVGPHYDPDRPASMSGGPVSEFFDAVLHVHEVAPSS